MKKKESEDIGCNHSTNGGLGIVRYRPVPDYIACPYCGIDLEFWSEEDRTRCFFCGQVVFLCEPTVH